MFFSFPYGALGQVWNLIVPNPDLCILPDKQEHEKDTTNMMFIVAIAAGSCSGLAIIIFLTIGVVVRHRRKQKRIER